MKKMLIRAGVVASAVLCAMVAAPGHGAVIKLPICTTAGNDYVSCEGAVPVDPTGVPYSLANPVPMSAKADQRTFTLASNQTLASGACGTPFAVDISAQYGWFNQIVSGTSPSVVLKFRAPDGTTYVTSAYTATATGSQFVPITAGANGSYVEVCNAGANSVTLYSVLAN